MRSDVAAAANPTLVSRAGMSVTLYPEAAPRELVLGTAIGGVDLTPFATAVSQSDGAVTLRLTHAGELFGVSRPRPGQTVAVRLGAATVLNGIVASVGPERETRGERSMQVVVRKRDAFPWWRDVRRMTTTFSVGVDLASIARSIAENLGLSADEYEVPNLGVPLAHDATQLADLNAWDMLELVAQPGLCEPYVDARGVLKLISRDLRRPADVVLEDAQVADVETNIARPPLTTMRVKWLDPDLSKSSQLDKPLASANLVAGFFKPTQRQELWFSDDQRQRAENVRMVVKQSINDGLFHVGSEWWTQTSLYGGEIHTEIDAWLVGELAIAGAALAAAHQWAEPVQVGPTGTGTTVPWYKAAAVNAAFATLLSVLASMGQGIYELRGDPYDFVHAVNETEAYDQDAEPWQEKVEELQNDLVPNELVAQGLAVNELIHRARAASPARLTIADDLRIEQGDVLGLPDGRRFYVSSDPGRDLSRGAEAIAKVEGYFA